MINAKPYRHVFLLVGITLGLLVATRAEAGLIPYSADYGIAAADGISGAGGLPPATVSESNDYYGTTTSYTFSSSYVSKTYVQAASATLDWSVGGTLVDRGGGDFRGETDVTSTINYAPLLANPAYGGYNEYWYAQMKGYMKYHLAVGDTMTYEFSGGVVSSGSEGGSPLYLAQVRDTITTPGDGYVNFSNLPSEFTTLRDLYTEQALQLSTKYQIQISIYHGAGETDQTTVNVDPGMTVHGTNPNAVPEPTSAILVGLGAAIGLGHLAKRRRSKMNAA